MLATDAGMVLRGVTGIVTALATSGYLAVSVLAHLHDRKLSGATNPVRVSRMMKPPYGKNFVGEPLPEFPVEWERQNIRWTFLRIHNLAETTTAAIPPHTIRVNGRKTETF